MYQPGAETEVAALATDAVLSAEVKLLQLLAARLAAGIEQPEWAVVKLGELQLLRAEWLRVLRDLDDELAAAAERAVAAAYGVGVAGAVRDVPRDRVKPPPALTATLMAITTDLAGQVTGKAPRVLRQLEDVYRDVVGQASVPGALGVETRRQVTERALAQFASRGVAGYVDRAGRHWSMESYTEMAVRSTMVEASRVGYEDTLKRSGYDLVYVIPGANACPDCDRWAGKVLLLNGGTDPDGRADATMSEARADGHLFGPNCGCGTAAYIDGISRPAEVQRNDPERYRAGQQQRGIERHIREWKRREAAAMSDEERARARGKVREWQGAMREHLAANEHLRRLPERERVRG